jgi:hypothetical protein
MSELSLRPLSRTFVSQPTISNYYEKPITPPQKEHYYHEICHTPPHKHNHPVEYIPIDEPKTMSLLEQSAIPLREERSISDPEYLVKPKVKRRSKERKVYISQAVQTDHELSSVPLIENFEVVQTKRFSMESHEPHLHHYRKLSHQSSRSVYVQ